LRIQLADKFEREAAALEVSGEQDIDH